MTSPYLELPTRSLSGYVRDRLEQVVGNLGAALVQAIPSDDQIIMGHVREAYDDALKAFRAARELEGQPGLSMGTEKR